MQSMQRETLEADVLIIGAGPAGLACAIRLLQLIKAHNASGGTTISEEGVFVLEKASELGAHSLSGAILDPKSLRELLGDDASSAPIEAIVQQEKLFYFTDENAIATPLLPPILENHGNWIVSLGQLVQWLGAQAESLGVNIFTGFAAESALLEEQRMAGVRTGDKGVGRDGNPKHNYEAGVDLRARYSVVAEGVRGSVAKQIIKQFDLAAAEQPLAYSLGIKEIWQLPEDAFAAGSVWHSLGFPLSAELSGGGWLYGLGQDRVSLGLVTGMSWRDPQFDPFDAFLQFKSHPKIAALLAQGTRLAYGAKAITRSDAASRPTAHFPGGLLIGEAAGYFHAGRLKGIHLAIKSGMLAAETLFEALRSEKDNEAGFAHHEERIRHSWLFDELQQSDPYVRASSEGWLKSIPKLALSFFTKSVSSAASVSKAPYQYMESMNIGAMKQSNAPLRLAQKAEALAYSGTGHQEDQPVHLKIADPSICINRCAQEFGHPCQYFCPAGVYEITGAAESKKLQIHAANCLHCKTCDILDP